MSATSFTDWRIACDWPQGCPAEAWGSYLGLGSPIRASLVRRKLRRLGWRVAVRQAPAGGWRVPRADYCLAHAEASKSLPSPY